MLGWVLAHRTGADSVRYSSLFVAEEHRGQARGLALLAEGFRRQHNADIPIARAAIDLRNIGSSRVSQAPALLSNQQALTTPVT